MIVTSSSSGSNPGVIFVIVGIVAGALQANGLRIALASRKWIAVPGHVRSAGIHDTGSSRDTTIANVRYTYDVAGHTHAGSRIRFGLTQSDMSTWEDVDTLNQFRDVTVYYDPEDRDQSVLEPGTTTGQWLGMAVSLAVLMLGIWLVMN